MTAHTIPADADLIALVSLNKQWEIEDALALRKAFRLTVKRPAALKGKETERANVRARDRLMRETLHG